MDYTGRRTILVVDDATTNLTAIKTILSTEYEVCLARSGEAALKVMERTKIDMVLLDIEMPFMTGFDVLEKIRGQPETAKIPVVFITADTTTPSILRAAKENVQGYIAKPIKVNILLPKLRGIFDALDREMGADFFFKNFELLEEACIEGRMVPAENIIKAMLDMTRELDTNYTKVIAMTMPDIRASIHHVDYDEAIRKIKNLVTNLKTIVSKKASA
jgi:CheY-like chemotaxis protein